MNFGQTFEKHMADRVSGAFMYCVRAIVYLSFGELKQAQHWLGRARRNLDDLQGDLSDEITRRDGEAIERGGKLGGAMKNGICGETRNSREGHPLICKAEKGHSGPHGFQIDWNRGGPL